MAREDSVSTSEYSDATACVAVWTTTPDSEWYDAECTEHATDATNATNADFMSTTSAADEKHVFDRTLLRRAYDPFMLEQQH